jgi:hypothetical protein
MTQNTPSAILMSPPAATAAPAGKPALVPEAAPDLSKVSEADFKSQMTSDFTPDQLRGLAAGEVKAGRLTQEQADAMLKADGVDGGALAEVDGFEGAKPHEYQMPGRGDYDPKQRAADMQIRTWLSTAKFPKDIGSSLAAEASKVLKAHAGMDETARELFKRTEAVKLRNLWGDKYEDRRALSLKLLTELDRKHPGVLDYVDTSGLGNSALFISLVHGQAERLLARATKAKG